MDKEDVVYRNTHIQFSSVTQSCPTLCNPMNCIPTGSLCQWDSPEKNTGVGCHFLLQGNLPDPGIEPTTGRFFTI